MDSMNTIFISQANHDFFMIVQLLCQTKKYKILKIKIKIILKYLFQHRG
jgi:hypothetical protein